MRLDFTAIVFLAVTSHLAVALIASAPGWYLFLSVIAFFGAAVMATTDPTPKPRRRRRS